MIYVFVEFVIPVEKGERDFSREISLDPFFQEYRIKDLT
jgi:hypothetical protein